jgi:glycosyltransferase involved in cell wall biosynthesis
MSHQSGKVTIEKPSVSFCMSTYKRPGFLKEQLECISRQVFTGYQVIISDNDPEASARKVVEDFNDPRVLYFLNGTNLGMVKSFNNSLARADTEYVVMITDDDPVYPAMLQDFFDIVVKYPGFPIYCGCKRTGREEGQVEVFDKDNFLFQMLHPKLTQDILWSSCLLRRDAAVAAGGMPDYGSPHLADHALLALCSKDEGGVMINRVYSEFSSHAANFSKANFELYYIGCEKFYTLITGNFQESAYRKGRENALVRHLEVWFITMAFNLRKFYAHHKKDEDNFNNASVSLSKILALPFMKGIYPKYIFKRIIFYIKYPFYQLGILK